MHIKQTNAKSFVSNISGSSSDQSRFILEIKADQVLSFIYKSISTQ